MNTEAIAALSPRWWSEMTSCTPVSPRARGPLKKAVQNRQR